MKRILFGLLIIINLGLGITISSGLGNENVLDPSLAEHHLDNLELLINLSLVGENSLKEADPDRYQQEKMVGEITSSVDINHALILSYDGVEIPTFLTDNFNRILRMTANYFNKDYKNMGVVIWMVDFETLQEIAGSTEMSFQKYPTIIATLYSPIFDYFFFTPRYMNDYYLVHTLLHYFIEHYGQTVADGLPQAITRQSPMWLSIPEYLKRNEETIVVELSKIIIRKALAPQALGLGETCVDCHTSMTMLASLVTKETVLEITSDSSTYPLKITEPDGLLVSEMFFADIHSKVSCVECHQGQSPGDAESSHQGLIPDPSVDGESCKGCHEDIVNYAAILHSALQSQISAINARSRPGMIASELAELNEMDYGSRHATCGECHVSRPDRAGGGLIEGHRFLKEPPVTETCAHCHQNSREQEFHQEE